jgi:hypothetical protein
MNKQELTAKQEEVMLEEGRERDFEQREVVCQFCGKEKATESITDSETICRVCNKAIIWE